MIPYGKQQIDDEDINAVTAILNSPFLTQGPTVPRFEHEICKKTGAQYSVACNSATSALHLACLALDLKAGDVVWTSPISFVASANCALYCDASIDFVDIDEHTFNMCANKLEAKLQSAEHKSKLPKVVIVVHFGGSPCDMKKVQKLSVKYGFKIIEDASHAIGARFFDNPVGSCHYSDITIFSFHPVKIITTGEGGCATTNDESLSKRMQLFRSHGVTRDTTFMTDKSHGDWYYQQIELGYNYRMTDLQAALGLSQLSKLDEFIDKRQQIALRYNSFFNDLPIKTQLILEGCLSSYHLFVIQLELTKTKLSHKEIFDFLRNNGVGVNLHYIPIHTQPYYADLGFKKGDFPEAETYYSKSISIPIFPNLETNDQAHICDLVGEVFN